MFVFGAVAVWGRAVEMDMLVVVVVVVVPAGLTQPATQPAPEPNGGLAWLWKNRNP